MKLKLKEDDGIHILSVDGSLDAHQFDVLKAGITKLFRDGKNRLILDLSASQGIVPEALKELGEMNVLARELSGEILLSGLDPESRTRVESLGKPSLLTCFPSIDAALGMMKKIASDQEESEPDEKTGGGIAADGPLPAVSDIEVDFQKSQEQIKELREKLRLKEEGELNTLRSKLVATEKENAELHEKIKNWIEEFRNPPSPKASDEKIKQLETKLVELQTQLEDLIAKKK